VPVDGGCKDHARIHPPAIEMHGAGTALTEIAAFLRAGEEEPFAQKIEQCETRINAQPVRLTVDPHGNFQLFPIIHVFRRAKDNRLTSAALTIQI
jgi:hypothetical protein